MYNKKKIGVISNYDINIHMQNMISKSIKKEAEFEECQNYEYYDAVIVFNHPKQKVCVRVNPDKVFAFHQEPGNFFLHPYMYFKTNSYSRVYTPLNIKKENAIVGPPFLPWHIDKNIDFLKSYAPTTKELKLSCISSNKRTLPGHKKRFKFVEYLKRSEIQCDFYGKGYKYVEDKWNALNPYKYSIAIENESIDNYFTEKITDCFLSYTIPIYYGCKNITDYFPADAVIQIDITKTDKSIRKITEIIQSDDYDKRIKALIEARNRVLNMYNPFQLVINIIKNDYSSDKKIQTISIHPINKELRIFLHLIHKFIRNFE